MTGEGVPGRCVLAGFSAADAALVEGLEGAERIDPSELAEPPGPAGGPVDLVVIGPQVTAAVSMVQRAHRRWPDASVAVVAPDPVTVRRQVSYAPGVPLDLLVAGRTDDLLLRFQELRAASIGRRRHSAVLAAVVHGVGAADAPSPSRVTAMGALLEHAPLAVLVAGSAGEVLGWNRRAEDLFGLEAAMRGTSVDDVIPGALSIVTSAPPGNGPLAADRVAAPPLHVRVADRLEVELSAVSSQTDLDRPVVLLLAIDVTEQRRVERERDRLAAQVDLLGQISESLMGSLDLAESQSRLAGALVPALADWVSIHLRDDHDQSAGVLIRHRDPALDAVVGKAERLKSRRGLSTEPSRRAAAGEAVLLRDVDAEELVAQVPDAGLHSLVRLLGTRSLIAVPVPGRTSLLGSLLLVRSPGSAPYTAADRDLAVEIGRRAGIALDNARLYSGQRHLATELQQSLLTDPPTVAFADIAVRYVAAGQQAQVGGDWYDAFRQRRGDLVLVIGDVVGHDTRAAAAMGQIRGLVRGICFSSADVPSRLLSSVDEAIQGLELNTMATAVLAQLSPPTADGRDVRMRWSNAGHPPPVLLDATGRAHLLEPGTGKADVLLGVDASARRTTEETTLPAGSTLLFYTDGLIERRGEDLDQGLRRLLATVEQHASADLATLCDAILEVMVPRAGEDDVAMVAVRPRSSSAEPVGPVVDGDDGASPATGRVAAAVDAARTSWRRLSAVPDLVPSAVLELTSLRQLGAVRRAVRAFLTESLQAGGEVVEDVIDEVVQRSILVIDELASNALRHGALPASLDLREAGDHWVVVATDSAGSVLPTPAVSRPAGQGGYGLYVIADLTSAHGVEVDGDRKHVWARLAKHLLPADQPSDAARS
ncbi:ATP-binding SpoIIE family protein phosphatase [Blastococcus goldschmidtiae]|uniref:SpoIIE family protein phosphatase n=1 Tax=Blastococcus goldschmidtiae TaxID=3075546 RepID=A0ABU2K5H5_9ACTN|nr:SpoIIE family protein phosphatase [Blastococcus sp. DSM 46792]MDT0275418.1 SpoIIE family protein phosphatase [Blastococcus sp. DSM 46792]